MSRTVLAASLLLLAGCRGSHDTGEVLATGGEVLPGSASDAMIPYDTLRSQPQRLAETPAPRERPADAGGPDTDEPPASAAPSEAPPTEAL